MLARTHRVALGTALLVAATTGTSAAATTATALVVTPFVQRGQVGTHQGWFPDFRLSWSAGVSFETPAAHKKSVSVLELDTVQFKSKNGKHQLGLDGGSGQAGTQEYDLYLPARATGDHVTLQTQPASKVKAYITGGNQPSLRVVGLPTATAEVNFDLKGTTGRSLLHLNRCSKGTLSEPVTATATATLAGGRHQTTATTASATCPK